MLQALDGDLLRANSCYFGGGTAIVLRHGEYRESVDIDFLVSDIDGYRELRQLVTEDGDINALSRHALTQLRDVRADQYGVRTAAEVDGSAIKFEINHEGRIPLEIPMHDDRICGITTLSTLDTAASKLLANADRWADRAVFSRDLIDLAMLSVTPGTLQAAIGKAANAYGTSIERCLTSAIDYLVDNPDRLGECMRALQMSDTSEAALWERITRLRP